MHATEIDETKFGAEVFKEANKCDEFKWCFGMICRNTGLLVMDYVQNRKMSTIRGIIK